MKLRIVHLGVLRPAATVGLLICVLWLLTSLEPVRGACSRETAHPWQSSERPSKAAARVLRVLRLLRGMLKTCQIAVSKPNRNSLWRFGSAR